MFRAFKACVADRARLSLLALFASFRGHGLRRSPPGLWFTPRSEGAIVRSKPKPCALAVRAGRAALAAAALVAALLEGAAYGGPPPDPQRLSFEAASIHQWGPGEGPAGSFAPGVQFSAGRVRSQCVSLQGLIFYAYDLTGSERLEGVPKWGTAGCAERDSAGTFTIEATMPPETTAAESRQMMQTLLAERFRLAAHWESRELPVYALRIATGRPKLIPSDPAKDPPIRPHSIGCPADDPHCRVGFCCGSSTISGLAGVLTLSLGRPVVDQTGLTGNYYFGVLMWAGDEGSSSSLPSLPSLLRDQFGLELKAGHAPVPVLVIDHVEEPLAN